MGRRGVQQLSPAEWREALEQQIREEQQRRRDGSPEAPQKRSQSAPQQEEGHVLGPERAVTTGGDDSPVVRGRRRYQHQQSQEEYLKGLQDQIEEKKRLAQGQLQKERTQRRCGSRSEEDVAISNVDEERGAESEAGNSSVKSLELQGRLEDAKMTASSNQQDVEPCHTPVVKTEVAADPEAITKIVDFCEELKKQNEDVKRQLLEQHAALASLHSTIAVGTDGKIAPRRRNSVLRERVVVNGELKAERATSSIKKAQAKGSEVKAAAALQVGPRPRPMRGESKIPLPGKRLPSSLRSAGANIVNGLSPQSQAKLMSPTRRAEAKIDPVDYRGSDSSEKSATALESPYKSSAKTNQVKDTGPGGGAQDPQDAVPESEAKDEDSPRKSASKTSQGKYIGSGTGVQDPQDALPESESKDEDSSTSSGEEVDAKSIGDLDGSSVYVKEQDGIGNERPMDAESRLVHDWATDGELLNCTSISILDGATSWIPLNRSLSKLF